jgi:hypothetical protein
VRCRYCIGFVIECYIQATESRGIDANCKFFEIFRSLTMLRSKSLSEERIKRVGGGRGRDRGDGDGDGDGGSSESGLRLVSAKRLAGIALGKMYPKSGIFRRRKGRTEK